MTESTVDKAFKDAHTLTELQVAVLSTALRRIHTLIETEKGFRGVAAFGAGLHCAAREVQTLIDEIEGESHG